MPSTSTPISPSLSTSTSTLTAMSKAKAAALPLPEAATQNGSIFRKGKFPIELHAELNKIAALSGTKKSRGFINYTALCTPSSVALVVEYPAYLDLMSGVNCITTESGQSLMVFSTQYSQLVLDVSPLMAEPAFVKHTIMLFFVSADGICLQGKKLRPFNAAQNMRDQ